jgi:hypothetical protein
MADADGIDRRECSRAELAVLDNIARDASQLSVKYNRARLIEMIRARQARQRAEQAAAAEELRAAVALFDRDPVATLRRVVAIVSVTERIHVEWTTAVAPRSSSHWRTIWVPPITTVEAGAVSLHEMGHVLSGPCPGTPPHFRDPALRRTVNCLQCEADAWNAARRLVPFDRRMFRLLQQCLATYQRVTPGPAKAQAALRHVASDSTYAAQVRARAAREARLDAIDEVRAAAEDARRSRAQSPTRHDKWLDMRRWAREANYDAASR